MAWGKDVNGTGFGTKGTVFGTEFDLRQVVG